jgi:hypothetical protein
MEPPVTKYLAEITERLARFERSLPRQIDILALSRSKLPFKALEYRETLIWRITELGQSALENFEAKKLAAAILLTRAAVETAAALWYLHTKVVAAIKADSVGDIDNYLMRLSLGHKAPTAKDEFPEAISVLTFLKHVEKELEGYEAQYAAMSEYSHPNYLGTTGMYAHVDKEKMLVNFGANLRGSHAAETIGVMNLSVALLMIDHSYNTMADLMPAFVRLCERDLKPSTET